MIEVNVSNLKGFKNELIDFLGEQFISDLEKFNIIGLKSAEATKIESNAHPLAFWWSAFKQDISQSESSNSLRLSEYSIRIIDLLLNFKTAQNISNFKRIIDSIKTNSKFYSGIFEVHVAAGYCKLGYDVEAIEENLKIGMKTCDLLVQMDEQKVFVECKSLDDPIIKETPLWNNLMERLSKSLEKYHRSWEIQIFAAKQINGKKLEIIFKEITKDIKQNNMSERSLFEDEFQIKYLIIAEWDKKFPSHTKCPKKSEITLVEFEMNISIPPSIGKIRVINVFPHTEFNISKRLINEFKKAKQQIPKNEIGIIHICIPYKDGSKLIQAVDNSYDQIFNEINLKTKRINAVVISNTVLEKNSQSPINSHYYIVPNITTRNDLPTNFSILGTNESIEGFELNDDGGKIKIGFTIPKEREMQLPLVIFHYSSHDGKHQIQIWKTWSDKLRMDIFTPSIGRLFVETESINLKSDESNKFTGTYIKRNVTIHLNGRKLRLEKNY